MRKHWQAAQGREHLGRRGEQVIEHRDVEGGEQEPWLANLQGGCTKTGLAELSHFKLCF